MRHPGSTKTHPTPTSSRPGRRPSRTTRRRGQHPAAPPAIRSAGPAVMRGLRGGRPDATETKALWTLTPAQRVAAMHTGQLALSQLAAWSAARPDEVPLIGGEFAWIAMHDPDYCESPASPGAI